MELAAGTRLGPYEIQRKVGAGGMGVVYRALDSRLGRAVAIKVLPPALRSDPDRLKRFEREARTIGGLNHPNLVTLHDVGEHDGTPFLVTELLEGRALRDLLRDGKVAPREAVRIASEIARGLAAAHGAGITHRDIKPENIFVTEDERVKILDFGIAKLTDDGTADEGSASTLAGPGVGTAHTGTGMVVGTPGYMAPEQLGGGLVGPRTDIFALGVVLHEMLAGRRPFATPEADSGGIEESYAILKQVPTELPTSVAPAIARVVRRCLEKRPEKRFQSASDLSFALADLDAADSDTARRKSNDAIAETLAQPAIVDDTVDTLPLGSPPELPDARPRVQTKPGIAPPIQLPAPATTASSPTLPVAPPTGRNYAPWIFAIAAVAVAGGLGAMWMARRAPARPDRAAPSAAATRWPDRVDGGPRYRRVTFEPQSAAFARFTIDQTAVVWSMRRGDTLWHVMQSGLALPSITDLQLGGRILDVSRRGELALRNKGSGEGGTLERGSPGMGAPQFVANHVEEAAWAPDGERFAILRSAEDNSVALEYPIGTVIFAPKAGGLALLRMAHDGNFLGVVETDAAKLLSGRVAIVDTAGKRVARSAPYGHLDGVAWAPDDHELWFSEGTTLHALGRDGRERVLLRSVLPIGLRDIATDGRILAAPRTGRARTLLGPPHGKLGELANVGWFDGSEVTGIARDGATIAFVETTGERSASGFNAFRRKGTETPVAIGKAFAVALYPDASAALALTGATTPLRVIPSDAQPPRDLPMGDIATFDTGDHPAIAWSARYAVVRAAAAGGRMRLWRYDLSAPTAPPVAVGPEGVAEGSHPITNDGAWIAIMERGKGLQLVSTTGVPTRHFTIDAKLAEVGDDDHVPLSFTEDETALFVMALHNYPRRVDRLDLATQAKTELAVIAPEDKPDLLAVAIDATGATLAYSVIVETSELYLIEPPAPVVPAPPP